MPTSKDAGKAIFDAVDIALAGLAWGTTGPTHDVVSTVRRHLPAAFELVTRAVKLSKGNDAVAKRLFAGALASMDAGQLASQVARDARVAKKPRRPR